MRKVMTLAVTIAAALLTLGALTGAAAANRLAVNEQNFSVAWNDLDFQGGTIQCDVTLAGSFHSRTISKVAGSLIGFVTSARVANCSFGITVEILQESLPWHIQYDSFRGTLPNIEGVLIRLIDAAFLLDILFGAEECLYQSTSEAPAVGIINIGSEGEARTLTADPGPQIPLFNDLNDDNGEDNEDTDCPLGGEFSGTGNITPNTIVVRLI